MHGRWLEQLEEEGREDGRSREDDWSRLRRKAGKMAGAA